MTKRLLACGPGTLRGMALIEALVAILIFSVGVIGVLGLQALALKSSSDAKYRADAAFLANQLIGQMWVDSRANLPSYAYNCNNTTNGCAPASSSTPPCPVSVPSGSSNQAYALRDAWISQLSLALPHPASMASSSMAQISVVPVIPAANAAETRTTYKVSILICYQVSESNGKGNVYHSYVTAAQIS